MHDHTFNCIQNHSLDGQIVHTGTTGRSEYVDVDDHKTQTVFFDCTKYCVVTDCIMYNTVTYCITYNGVTDRIK